MSEDLWEALRDSLQRGVFAKFSLGDPDDRAEGARKLSARPVEIKGGSRLQLVWSHDRRDVTKNLPVEEAIEVLAGSFPSPFRAAHLATTERTLQMNERKGKIYLSKGPAAHAAPSKTSHDRVKQRRLEPDARWLDALAPRRQAEPKRRQVHRFIEILDHWLAPAARPADGRTRWVDVGCGSGALTFAAWEYLTRSGFGAAVVEGIELRPELAEKTEQLARSLGCSGLSFRAGAAAEVDLGEVDGVIALHACDTATDDALAAGVKASARWLLAAPCCHKELRPKLSLPPDLAPVGIHGILQARTAEIATDALRAALLEAAGYEAKVFEFISTEHTDKNLMIAATRRESPLPGALQRAQQLAQFYGVSSQRLAQQLGIDLKA